MNAKLGGTLLLLPLLAFPAAALARGARDAHRDRPVSQPQFRHVRGSGRYGIRAQLADRNRGQDRHLPRYRDPPVRHTDPSPVRYRGGSGGASHPHRGGWGDHGRGHGGGGDHWHYRGDHDGGDHHRGRWYGDRDDWPRYRWHGDADWRADIRLFPRYGWNTWRNGYWYHGWYGGRWGWWWLAGGLWFWYPAPVYPYPDPYVPGSATVADTTPSPPPAAPARAPTVQYWYHCAAPKGYYPYVSKCPGGWTKVPATPPGTSQSAAKSAGR